MYLMIQEGKDDNTTYLRETAAEKSAFYAREGLTEISALFAHESNPSDPRNTKNLEEGFSLSAQNFKKYNELINAALRENLSPDLKDLLTKLEILTGKTAIGHKDLGQYFEAKNVKTTKEAL